MDLGLNLSDFGLLPGGGGSGGNGKGVSGTSAGGGSSASGGSSSSGKKQSKQSKPRPSSAQSPAQTNIIEELLSRKKLADLLHEISPGEHMEPEVELALLEIADDFVDSVTSYACKLAAHRGASELEAKDVRLHLEKSWDLKVPGFTHPNDTSRLLKRKNTSDVHKQRMDLVKKASATDGSAAKRAKHS